MKVIYILFIYVCMTWLSKQCYAQNSVSVDKPAKYMFYLHGRIIEEQGIHAVSPDYGSYEYLAILDSLNAYGFIVISEARAKNTNELLYAEKVSKQIDSLLNKGVPPNHIYVLGASKGAYITLLTAREVQNKEVNYIVMGVCSFDNTNYWSEDKIEMCGNFLSIYEASDTFGGTCYRLLGQGSCISGFEEVKLNMGNRHGFLYKPYSAWINPLMKWVEGK